MFLYQMPEFDFLHRHFVGQLHLEMDSRRSMSPPPSSNKRPKMSSDDEDDFENLPGKVCDVLFCYLMNNAITMPKSL